MFFACGIWCVAFVGAGLLLCESFVCMIVSVCIQYVCVCACVSACIYDGISTYQQVCLCVYDQLYQYVCGAIFLKVFLI